MSLLLPRLLLGSIVLSYAVLAAGCGEGADSSTGNELSETTKYGELHSDAPPETEQWGQLVGEWDAISRDLIPSATDPRDSTWYENRATWTWEYVLGGYAVFNRWWQEDNSPAAVTDEYFATGLFVFNPEQDHWEAVVLNSRRLRIPPTFQATYQNGEIHMHDGTGTWQVTFFDLQETSFEWKYEVRTPEGGWRPISTISATRRPLL